eukprot:TCONS_00025992-protein
MVIQPDIPNQDLTDCEYRRKETQIRQQLLANFLQAMREDLAEWISSLSVRSITQENFLSSLENGVILCQQARLIQRYAEEYSIINKPHNMKIPNREVTYTEKGAFRGSFISRDNVANFIQWCRGLGIPDVCLFESEDLVLHKNEKSVILTLLDVARKAFVFGVQPPEIVRFEQEIDQEIEEDKQNEKKGKPPPKPIDLEEDNNLDTLVRNIVNRCTCYDRFPIKKLSEGKYQFGEQKTLIFVRVMRKHVMVRIGGGWDTFEHYITKHDPCRTTVAGSIDNNGQSRQTQPPARCTNLLNNSSSGVSPRRKKSVPDKRETHRTHECMISTTSSDTWSMCSGSSEGSGSTDGRPKPFGSRKESMMSTSSTETPDTSLHFTKSIEEIDRRLQSMEDRKPTLDMTIKDPSVYEHRADSWLRHHLNSLKQNRRASDAENLQPMDAYQMKRGYTADVIERRPKAQKENTRTPKMERRNRAGQVRARSATGTNTPISKSIDQGLNHDRISAYSPASNPTPDGFFSSDTLSVSSSTNSLQSLDSHRKSCSEIATQTDDLFLSPDGSIPSNIPGPLRKKLATVLGSPSKIPRPVMQRSKTMELPSAKLKRRNSTNSHDRERLNQRAPRMQREKSQPNFRREKSDVGQSSKYKMVQSPGPRRRESMKKEKPVRVRNGPVLTTQV